MRREKNGMEREREPSRQGRRCDRQTEDEDEGKWKILVTFEFIPESPRFVFEVYYAMYVPLFKRLR